MATSRETLKYYFRKYALPTEQQFAELIDAFVHKDEDLLTQEKIDGLVAALEEKVTTETFENFKTEIQTQIGNGTITVDSTIDSSSTNPVENRAVYEALEDKVDKTDVETNYWKKEDLSIDSSIDSSSTNPVENRAVYEALQDKAEDSEFQELKTKIEAFLEDTDASDEAINKWKEIESFLQGIKDTETLTGMLADLKAEILESIPETPQGNFVEQITDMTARLETAEIGKIVQYIGATNEKYRRGFCYEKKTNSVTIPSETYYVELPKDFPGTPAGLYTLNRTVQENIKKVQQTFTDDDGTEYYSGYYEQGGYVWNDSGFYKITENSNPGSFNETLTLENGLVLTKKANARQTSNLTSYKEYINSHGDILKWSYGPILITTDSGGSKTAVTFVSPFIGGDWEKYNNNSSSLVLGESGWTVIPVSPCVN